MEKAVLDVRELSAKQYIEKHLISGLAAILGGKTEVKLRYGIADVVTPTHVYEVKEWKDWRHAIGQAIIYALELGLRPGIAIFVDRPSVKTIRICGEVCQRLGVDLLFHFLEDETRPADALSANLTPLPIPPGLPDMTFEIRTIKWVRGDHRS